MSSAVWIQYTNVTDRQTDGRTPGDSTTALTHSLAQWRLSLSPNGATEPWSILGETKKNTRI